MTFWRRKHPFSTYDLSAYADGRMDAAASRRLEAHMEGCEACRSAVTETRALKAMLSAMPRVEPRRSFVLTPALAGTAPPAAARRSMPLAFAPAVAFALLVALLAVDLAVIGGGGGDDAAMLSAGRLADAQAESAPAPAAERSSDAAAPPLAPAREGTPAVTLGRGAADATPAAGPPATDKVAPTEAADSSTAQTVVRVLQVLAGLALLGSLFALFKARVVSQVRR